jgi:hypothetical protein
MFLQRIFSGLLMAILLILAILPMNLAAQEVCTDIAQAPHELALFDEHGQVFLDIECADGCVNDAADAMASYARAIQSQDNVMVDVQCADGCSNDADDAMATYERAVLQAHGQVMADSSRADCGIRA